ncbi:hypothetical protein D9M70_538200 [compost metagenome]
MQVGDAGTGFFQGFPGRSLLQGLAVFHEAGGQGPEALARGDGAPAEQDASFPHGQAAGDDAWVLVMHGQAPVADVPWAIVAAGDSQTYAGAALAAELHAHSLSDDDQSCRADGRPARGWTWAAEAFRAMIPRITRTGPLPQDELHAG